jgi:hypothetical protein
MDEWKKYIEYLNDNPEGYWFKRRLYGLGWVPATKEGWAVLVLFFGFFAFVVFSNTVLREPNPEDMKWFLLQCVGAVLLLLIVCYKTGEPPKWMWGFPKKESDRT